MGIFGNPKSHSRESNVHDFDDAIHMSPPVKRCKRCGRYMQAGRGDFVGDDINGGYMGIADLPREIMFAMTTSDTCEATSEYSEFQYTNAKEIAYKQGWLEGQNSGIHLQDEFTRLFFSKIRKRVETNTYEIPSETYDIIKMQLIGNNPPKVKEQNHGKTR